MRTARTVIVVGFALVLVAVLAVALLLQRSRQADMWVGHTFEVQQTAQALLISFRDATSSLRTFLLTKNRDYLTTYDKALKNVPLQFEKLRALSADNLGQQGRADKLTKLIGRAFDRLHQALSLAEEGDDAGARNILDSIEMRTLIGDVRDEIAGILTTERQLFATRQARAVQFRNGLLAGIAMALLAATLLAAVLAISTRRAIRGLLELTAELDKESKLRQEAESTLRQAQKMEAVGQLTGGIAHDFNNILTIIIGNLDTMKRHMADMAKEVSSKLIKPLEAALLASTRATQLTHRLLAFSRRQALDPVRLDLNKLVSSLLDMLRRSLGSQIEIESVLGAGLWPTLADTNQMENALLNLALNAKDAMPNGGCLTIETANTYLDAAYVSRFGDVEAGQYVVLCVTDTGTGIAKDILDRVFEPFFTTKPAGEGSGLGLAMVHGFVKQSGGHMRIYSEEGHGTTVKIYLPRLTKAEEVSAAPAGKIVDVSPTPRAREGETILIVEDNEGVREYAKGALEELGYRVVEAGDADQALAVLDRPPRVDLLFTDVVLPGPDNGRVLATKARQKYPDLPVLYTTGYTRNAIVHQGRLDADVELLNKPYTQQDLARKVRELLDG
jgi:signal transduction histidine kinase